MVRATKARLNMNTRETNEIRELTADELAAVSGGMSAMMYFGECVFVISADANGHQVYGFCQNNDLF
jgi:bacteriocin-like protein